MLALTRSTCSHGACHACDDDSPHDSLPPRGVIVRVAGIKPHSNSATGSPTSTLDQADHGGVHPWPHCHQCYIRHQGKAAPHARGVLRCRERASDVASGTTYGSPYGLQSFQRRSGQRKPEPLLPSMHVDQLMVIADNQCSPCVPTRIRVSKPLQLPP